MVPSYFAFAVLFALAGCSRPSGASEFATPKPVQFDVPSVAGGRLRSTDIHGKVAVIDFWATWCDPCIKETPQLNAIYDKYKGRIVFLGIAIQSGGLDDVKPKVEDFGMRYPVGVGDDETETAFGGHIGFPMTYVLAKDGTVDKKYLGSTPFKKSSIERELDQLLTPPPQ